MESAQPLHHETKTLLSWSAYGRPYVRRGKQFYLTATLLAILICIILFLFHQYLFIFLVGSFLFVAFAFAYTPPKNYHYKISSEGILIEKKFYLWEELYDFYFMKKNGEEILYVRTESFYPGALVIPLGELPKDQVKQAIINYLPYREYVEPTFMDKSGDWLVKNFPLEKN